MIPLIFSRYALLKKILRPLATEFRANLHDVWNEPFYFKVIIYSILKNLQDICISWWWWSVSYLLVLPASLSDIVSRLWYKVSPLVDLPFAKVRVMPNLRFISDLRKLTVKLELSRSELDGAGAEAMVHGGQYRGDVKRSSHFFLFFFYCL